MKRTIGDMEHALRNSHRQIQEARRHGMSAEVMKQAEREWCDLLAELNRELCKLGALDPQYAIDGQLFVTYGCDGFTELQEVNGHLRR